MKISRLTFVVIAHNEQFALQKCLASISRMSLDDCEIICVDSGSTDNTLQIACAFKEKIANLRIIQVTGHQNAAIARNAGLAYATKDCVFFIDGDVELNEEFIVAGLEKIRANDADAVFGVLDDSEYDKTYSDVVATLENRTSIYKEEKRYLCGGIFMVRKSVVDEIGTFDGRFVKCEDFDYTLRITRKYILKALPVLMGIHHTVPYSNTLRLKNELKNMLPVYYGALLRKNIRNYRGCVAHVNKAGYLKGLSVISVFIGAFAWPWLVYPGLALVSLDIAAGLRKRRDIRYRLVAHYVVPLFVVYGFIFGIKDAAHPATNVRQIWASAPT